MTDMEIMQEHFTAITEDIDKYHESDRAFILWYLLQDYINDSKDQIKTENIEDVKDYALQTMLMEHIRVGEQMRDVLFYNWS